MNDIMYQHTRRPGLSQSQIKNHEIDLDSLGHELESPTKVIIASYFD